MDEALKRNLIVELGIDKLPVDKQEEVLLQAGTVIFQSILARVVPLLSDKEQDDFEALLDNPQGDEPGVVVFQFLKETIPDLDNIIKEEIADFKRESFEVMSKIG